MVLSYIATSRRRLVNGSDVWPSAGWKESSRRDLEKAICPGHEEAEREALLGAGSCSSLLWRMCDQSEGSKPCLLLTWRPHEFHLFEGCSACLSVFSG